jgi:hypothetical protein
MKKVSSLLLVLFLGITFYGFSQTPPKDFFTGKWEISLTGTPNGEVTFFTNLTRKEGKLTGELVNPEDPTNGKRAITKVEESGDKMAIYFKSSQGDEISLHLAKVDSDNLKGSLMNSFDAKAVRLK